MRFRRHPPPPQPQSPAEGSQWTVAGEASPSALSSTAAPPPPSSQEKLIFGGEPVENEGDRWLSRLQVPRLFASLKKSALARNVSFFF